MLGGDVADFDAVPVGADRQARQQSDLVDPEAEVAAPADERQAIDILVRVVPVPGGAATCERDPQGSELISRDMNLWAYQRGVALDFSRPGKPHRQCPLRSSCYDKLFVGG